MHFKNKYALGKTVALWLTGFYCFWIAFIVAIALAQQFQFELGIIFLFFLIIGFSLLVYLLVIIKQQIKHLLLVWKKVLLISFIPFLYCWLFKQYFKNDVA